MDASVIIKWYLADEPFAGDAGALFADFREARVSLLAPTQLRYEVANAIWKAVRSRRLSADDGETAIRDFFSWRLRSVGSDGLILAAYAAALRYNCALYDALYLALADMAQCPLVHADRRLHNTLGGRFERELWIADYAPAEE